MAAHVPKAQGLKCHGRDPRPCNRESARDRQTDKLSAHYSKIIAVATELFK